MNIIRYLPLILISLGSIFGVSLIAQEPDAAEAEKLFISGNVHYGEGNFEEARDTYQQALRHGHSHSLHFNLANTYFQLGYTGRAVLHYLRAQALVPTDSDTEANLRFVREAAGLQSDPVERAWLGSFANGLPPNVWTTLAIAGLAYASFVTFVVSARRRLGVGLKLTATISVLVSALAFSALAHDLATYQMGVVIADPAELRVAPTATSPTHSTATTGETAHIREQRTPFYNLRFSDGRTGYLHINEFVPLRKDTQAAARHSSEP